MNDWHHTDDWLDRAIDFTAWKLSPVAAALFTLALAAGFYLSP